ncbi:proton channel OTOP3-like [Notolabrus celidotus]|uniref:proton channel OTOP3-like n=1 Tax=Notolabrus celidotus TaxID=1203425 RepID=UPI00149059D3|nr:proton channel OTOP3-like [Notolabrus celidotus]
MDSDPGVTELDLDPRVTELDSDPGVTELDSDPRVTELDSDPGVTELDLDPGVTELDLDPGVTELDSPVETSDHQIQEHDPMLFLVPTGRRLISGLLGLNVVLMGSALILGQALNPAGLRNQEPQVLNLLLMGVSGVWMLWYLLWARRQPGFCPHKDHHAGGIPVTFVLMLFAAFTLLLYVCRIGYFINTRECKHAVKTLSPFIEAPFVTLQTYLLWAHSKDCIHRHKIISRSGLMVILSADLLLWLHAVTEDTIHEEIELEKEGSLLLGIQNSSSAETLNVTGGTSPMFCLCSSSAACLVFRKAIEVLYPFHMEYYLMAGCMVYVMWKNVGRRMSPGEHHEAHKLTLKVLCGGGILYGLVFGGLVLLAGVTVFILYQVFVNRPHLRHTAFLIFYSYHLAVMPIMSLCSLAGMLVHVLERRASEGGHNPTRSLDVMLLLAAALGQLALSYFSLVAALAVGTEGPLGDLDLSYSLLSLLELILQNIFIIKGLHRHPSLLAKKKGKQWNNIFKLKKTAADPKQEDGKTDLSLLEGKTQSAAQDHDGKKVWMKRAIQEICAFLILANVMLWIIPAFGVHPQFENGIGKRFFGFSAWFVLVNLVQPLSVFYRMHAVGALMELLLNA